MARQANQHPLVIYRPRELEAMPTLSTGHMHDLKVEEEVEGIPTRWWLSRMTIEDGEKHAVYVEQLIDGRWTDVWQYGYPGVAGLGVANNPGTRKLKNRLLK